MKILRNISPILLLFFFSCFPPSEPLTETEPNNSFATANYITSTYNYRFSEGSLSNNSDIDYFYFYQNTNSMPSIIVFNGANFFDFVLKVYDEDFSLIAEINEESYDDNELYVMEYYFGVSRKVYFSISGTGTTPADYSIKMDTDAFD